MKSPTSIIFILFSLFASSTIAQSGYLSINNYIKFPEDSIESKKLILSIEKFLESADFDNKDNQFILPSEDIETFILLDEIWHIRYKNNKSEGVLFKPYLNNIVAIEDGNYLIQVSYISNEDNKAILRASFEFIAHPTKEGYLFSSPLKRNTKNWKKYQARNNTFYYEVSINKESADSYTQMAELFDKKLKSKNKTMDYYCCTDLQSVLKLIGVNYKLDYNGRSYTTFNSVIGDRKLIVSGEGAPSFSTFDPHDLWHYRLSLVKSRREVNKHVDEACAYLYGGSWGIRWEDILQSFKEKVANDVTIDWTVIKEQKLNFGDSQEKHLIADYVVTALIVEDIESKQGFSAVWRLLDCGVYEKGNENFYQVLEELTGTPKSAYNEYVWKLLNQD